MIDEIEYLSKGLGLRTKKAKWDDADRLPAFLRLGNELGLVETPYGYFVLARPRGDASLPEVKRTHEQLGRWTSLPVVVSVQHASARQRAALVRQGIPFVCAGREAFLPFVALASRERGENGITGTARGKLSAKGLQALCWSMANHGPFTLAELRDGTAMSPGQASSAASELVEAGVATSSKEGRVVFVSPLSRSDILRNHMALLSSPVRRSLLVRRTALVDALPDAGETALATRTMLEAPTVLQKAISSRKAKELSNLEVLEGELFDDETAQVQVWRYEPVMRGETEVDDVSLALSLADNQDERAGIEVDSLFGEEYPWQEAL